MANEGREIQQQRDFQLKEKIRLHIKRFPCTILNNDDIQDRVSSFSTGTRQISIKSGFNEFEIKNCHTYVLGKTGIVEAEYCFHTITTNL